MTDILIFLACVIGVILAMIIIFILFYFLIALSSEILEQLLHPDWRSKP